MNNHPYFEQDNTGASGASAEQKSHIEQELTKKVKDLETALHNERQEKHLMRQSVESIQDKAKKFDDAVVVLTNFQKNPSIENAEAALGLSPGTLTKNITKKEAQTTDTEQMPEEFRPVIDQLKGSIADETKKLEAKIAELERRTYEKDAISTQRDYQNKFESVMEKEFDNYTLAQQKLIAPLMLLYTTTGKMTFQDATKKLKDDFQAFQADAQKKQVEDAKKVVDKVSRTQLSAPPSNLINAEPGKRLTRGDVNRLREQAKESMMKSIQEKISQLET